MITASPALRLRNAFLLCLYALSALWGISLAVPPQDELREFCYTVLVAIAVVVSCIYDARFMRKPIVSSVQGVMLFTWPIAVPAYLVWSRGLKRGLQLVVVHAVCLYGVMVAGYWATSAAIYGW